jgi:hypothetical protein
LLGFGYIQMLTLDVDKTTLDYQKVHFGRYQNTLIYLDGQITGP